MAAQEYVFDETGVLTKLKHYLPAQAPLKDFVHHNTLHAFQQMDFHKALTKASVIFGYNVYLSLEEYRKLAKNNTIRPELLEQLLIDKKGVDKVELWKFNLLNKKYAAIESARIGRFRKNWKKQYGVELEDFVNPVLFRILCNYLDQGISIWSFPVLPQGLLKSLKEIEENSFISYFKSERIRKLFLSENYSISDLLKLLVGQERYYETYLFDQQFSHPGWSGIVSTIEDNPHTLVDPRKISLEEVIKLELLLELDFLDALLGKSWKPLADQCKPTSVSLFDEVKPNEVYEVLSLFQEAYEWSYYDTLLAGIAGSKPVSKRDTTAKNFQALFCIDDRECSLRRNIETIDSTCETFGTPGFFNVEFYFQPEYGKFYTKLCPAPVNPKYLIKEYGTKGAKYKDVHFTKKSHSIFQGWFTSQTVGFESAFRLFWNIFKPSMSPATSSSLKHMDKVSELTIECNETKSLENRLQIGFTIEEMANRLEVLLKSIGLVDNFAPLVYAIGHGSSTINNPHYAAYDCGACCGRPGSVNARVICNMANRPEVRLLLKSRGVTLPENTYFVGGIHDTTRDDIEFFDEQLLPSSYKALHDLNKQTFTEALHNNAKERSRRFESIDTKLSPEKIHEQIQVRSVSLFEPRPELNHASNALCMVGLRSLSKKLFLDRRAFMNSYYYKIDSEGTYLTAILNAVAPVCGGINLEYYFSRVDNEKLGTGTKLPHNVMGLFGVANGTDGDLRPGLPVQMIEVHDPIRLMVVVEQYHEVVLSSIKRNSKTFEWFQNNWIHLVAVNPDTHALHVLQEGEFIPYLPKCKSVSIVDNLFDLIEKSSSTENIPVCYIN